MAATTTAIYLQAINSSLRSVVDLHLQKLSLERRCDELETGAWGGNRTRTRTKSQGILSPLRLPIPPPRQGGHKFRRLALSYAARRICQKTSTTIKPCGFSRKVWGNNSLYGGRFQVRFKDQRLSVNLPNFPGRSVSPPSW